MKGIREVYYLEFYLKKYEVMYLNGRGRQRKKKREWKRMRTGRKEGCGRRENGKTKQSTTKGGEGGRKTFHRAREEAGGTEKYSFRLCRLVSTTQKSSTTVHSPQPATTTTTQLKGTGRDEILFSSTREGKDSHIQ